MKKYVKLLSIFIILAFSISPAFAGQLNFGAKASVHNPTVSGASPTIMYGIVADYEVNRMIHARASIEYTTYTVSGISYSLMPITFDVIVHFMPGQPIDPYLGGGAGYYKFVADNVDTSTMGLQAIAGITMSLGGLSADFEVGYYIPDASKTSEGSVNYGGNVTGYYGVSIPF